MTDDTLDPKFIAGVKLLERTGARQFQVRWSDDEQPVVWFAVVAHYLDRRGRPVGTAKESAGTHWDAAAGMNPVVAVLRLCELLIDGGQCSHCGRPTIFHADIDENPTPLDPLFCSYEWDPELAVFRRGCEGDDE